jgi:hypothetical protein
LVDFVGGDIGQFVVAWFGVAREHDLVFHGLAFNQLRR